MKRLLTKISPSRLQIISNTVIVFGYRIFQKLISFAVIYFLVRALTPEQYGEYNFILSLLSFCSITALPGLQESVTQSSARGLTGTYRKAQPLAMFASIAGSLVLAIFSFWHSLYGSPQLGLGFLIVALLFPFCYGLEQWKGLRKGMEDFKTIVKMGGLFSTIQGTLIISSVLLIPQSYLLPIFFLVLTPILKNLYMTYKAYKLVPPNLPVEKNSLTHGFKVTGYSSFNIIANNIDSILLFSLLSPEALAIYAVANKLPELIKKLVQDIGSVLTPRFARHDKYTAQTDRYIKVFSLISGLIIVAFAFTVMPFCITFIFSDLYTESIIFAQVIMCSLAIGNVSILQSRYISSKLDTKSYRDITIIMSMTRILASVILVPLYGIWGAIISIFIYRLTMTATVQVIMSKRYKVTKP